jgi:hypothetical protein
MERDLSGFGLNYRPLRIVLSWAIAAMDEEVYERFRTELNDLVDKHSQLILREEGTMLITENTSQRTIKLPKEAIVPTKKTHSRHDLADFARNKNMSDENATDLWRWLATQARDRDRLLKKPEARGYLDPETSIYKATFPLAFQGVEPAQSIDHESLIPTALWIKNGIETGETHQNHLLTELFIGYVNSECLLELAEPIEMPRVDSV